MATYSKTNGLTLFALGSVAASSVGLGAPVDVSTKMGGLVYPRFGRRSATAATAGCNIRLEASDSATLDNSWFPFCVFTSDFAACIANAVLGTVLAGTNVITTASTASLSIGDLMYIDNTVIASSEWGRVKSFVANTSITLEDNLINAQTGSTFYNLSEIYSPIAIPEGAMRIRAVIDASQFTQACAAQVLYSTIDGFA